MAVEARQVQGQTRVRAEKDKSLIISKEEAIRRVEKALDEIQYGEVVIKVQGGKPVWVDKYERERVG